MTDNRELIAARDAIEIERAKVSGDDGYNYAAGQEYGLRLAGFILDKRIAALAVPQEAAAVIVGRHAEHGDAVEWLTDALPVGTPLYAAPAVPAVKVTPTELNQIGTTLSFFASVIKSGEGWTARCQTEFDAAQACLSQVLSALEAPEAGWRPTHRHKKRGTTYRFDGYGEIQTDAPLTDYAKVAIYRAEDGKTWVRPVTEFEDGRFEALPSPPMGGQ